MRPLVLLAALLASPTSFAHPPDWPGAGPRGLTFPWQRGNWIGVQTQAMTPELRDYFGAPRDRGVLVSSVVEGSPAAKAGLRAGDVILKAGDREVREYRDLVEAVQGAEEGQTLAMEVLRERRTEKVDVRVEENPEWKNIEREVERGIEGLRGKGDAAAKELQKRIEKLEREVEELRRKLRKL